MTLTVVVCHTLVENMFSVLKSFLGQVPLPLDLDVQGGGDVRHEYVNQLTNTKHNMLKDDHKRKLDCENFPMNRSEESFIISKSSVVALRLKKIINLNNLKNKA